MRKKAILSLLGLITVVLAFGGLLAVINTLANTGPIAPARNITGSPSDVNDSGNNAGNNDDFISNLPDISLAQFLNGETAPHIPLFDVTGAANLGLLRSQTADFLSDNIWSADNASSTKVPYNGEKLTPAVKNYSSKSIDSIQITPIEKSTSGPISLPSALNPISMTSDLPLYYLPEQQLFLSEQGLPDSYSFEAAKYNFAESTLENAKIAPDSKYLQLPDSTTDRTRQLAQEITANINSPYGKAKALEEYLKQNYTYDYNYEAAPKGTDAVDWFLFEDKRGVCTQFNSAFVTLARAVEIPSRLTGGYAITPEDKTQVVYADQAHAWAEVDFQDLGWITFDATGSSPQPLDTVTNITGVNPEVRKGHSFYVKGSVQSAGTTVDGVMVEIYINSRKSTEGGLLIGKGIASNGGFDIEVNIPQDKNVGNYQLLAHTLSSGRFKESWSDPALKVTSETSIVINTLMKVKVKDPLEIAGELQEESGKPIAGQPVTISQNGKAISRVNTNATGYFQLSQTFNQAGDYVLKAAFNGSEFYLNSSQEFHIQVMTPTQITVQTPLEATTDDSVSVQGFLREENSDNPVANQTINITITGLSDKLTAVTDKNGFFHIQHKFEEEGIYSIEALFTGAPYYWESQAGTALQVTSSQSSPIWYYPVIAILALVAAGGALIFYLRRRRLQPVIESSNSSVAQKVLEEPKEAIEANYQEMAKINIYFPDIISPYPDVWGVGDSLELKCQLVDMGGIPLSEKSILVTLNKPIANIKTDSDGNSRAILTFTEKGLFNLKVEYKDEAGKILASAFRGIRIVDYREEIVNLYKEMQNYFRNSGINIPQDATPRETEQIILKNENSISTQSLNTVIECFEETEYSLHSIRRQQYLDMYKALVEIGINGTNILR